MRNGYTPSKSNPAYWEGGTIPWFRMEDLRTSGRILEDSIQHITPEAVKGKGLFKAGSILMATTATIGEHALLIADSLANQQFTNFAIRESLMGVVTPMFAYYYFFLICEWCKRNVYESSFPSVDMKRLREVRFPIPPVAVQEEVVRVLDKFTALEAELEVALSTELDCRKRQYQYYRDALLTFDLSPSDGLCHSPLFPVPFAVKWHPLGEVGEFTRGSGLQKKDFTTEGVGCIHYGQIYTHYGTFAFETKTFVSEEFAQKARKAQCGDLVIATTSENDEDLCKAVAWLGKEEVVVSSDACFYTHKMAPKYVSYFFQSTHFQKQKRTFITGTKVRRVNAKDLAKIEIPIPPLAVQERIVEILDKYEYYRDALLSF